jgi:hypothetical protein
MNRLEQELKDAKQYMPANTVFYETPTGTKGWLYTITCELGNQYTLFLYYDGGNYQVLVIDPEIEHKYKSVHTGHLFSSSRICLNVDVHNSGAGSLREAYSKSVLWATGFSGVLNDIPFVFNYNQ